MKYSGTFEDIEVARIIARAVVTEEGKVADDQLLSCAREIRASAERFVLLMSAAADEQACKSLDFESISGSGRCATEKVAKEL
jgi:hypothetical protein